LALYMIRLRSKVWSNYVHLTGMCHLGHIVTFQMCCWDSPPNKRFIFFLLYRIQEARHINTN
jgi:hypothetical protein